MPPGIFFPPGNNFGGRDPGDTFQRQFDLPPHFDIPTVLSFGIGRRSDLISLVRPFIFHSITSVNDIGPSQALAANHLCENGRAEQSIQHRPPRVFATDQIIRKIH